MYEKSRHSNFPSSAHTQDIYFSSYQEARATGCSRIRRGESTYKSRLDRTKDGIAWGSLPQHFTLHIN
ncbi:excalibur calcium-binding domain-containing protein [Corynebacterium pseudotuberculosis]|uniref:excalibur calcium-binding domain-containing protein n=1 Tax=Corynebacterium pseudotuberculosis TaxID=1719 RepID=UPI0018C72108